MATGKPEKTPGTTGTTGTTGGTGATPRQRGRLVFCPHGVRRMDYGAEFITTRTATGEVCPLGWVARAPCLLGDHYLAPDETAAGRAAGRVVERATSAAAMGTRQATPERSALYLWPDVEAALAAIDQLARQQTETPDVAF